MESPKLLGKIFIEGIIHCETGLHIGTGKEKVEIGGVDNPVIRDPITNYPYIPGSSLKGKARSCLETYFGKPLKGEKTRYHYCDKNTEGAEKCEICRIFGKPAEEGGIAIGPTRLTVLDCFPTEDTVNIWKGLDTELQYTEVKWENAIDRLTSEANPRQMERVPKGSEFSMCLLYDIYDKIDLEYLRYVFTALKLVEDSFLGGQGSRGYGRVRFKNVGIQVLPKEFYKKGDESLKIGISKEETIAGILAKWTDYERKLAEILKVESVGEG